MTSSGPRANGDGASDLGPAPSRVVLDAITVQALVADQFPQWAHLPVAPVPRGGWDNQTFRLGRSMLVRLPSAAEYALGVEKERRLLPELARQLPLPIPSPLANGVPGPTYPYPWSVYGWLEGERSTVEGIADPVQFAVDLAAFVVALRAVDAAEGPRPGLHNWYRGGTLRTFDDLVQRSLARLGDEVDRALFVEIWADAVTAAWDGPDVWFHGDLAEGNLLLRQGHLAAVIDFGTCGVGDPSCDLAVAWTMLDVLGRNAFRDHLGVDDVQWRRGRGWALWKSLSNLVDALDGDDPVDAAKARRALTAVTTEWANR